MVSELHQRYTRYINFKKNWRGHLWQGRFFSVALSPEHFDQCIRYVELNPLRASIITEGQTFEWVSDNISDIKNELFIEDYATLREMTRTGRPRGSTDFLTRVRSITGIDPVPGKAGRKRRLLDE